MLPGDASVEDGEAVSNSSSDSEKGYGVLGIVAKYGSKLNQTVLHRLQLNVKIIYVYVDILDGRRKSLALIMR